MPLLDRFFYDTIEEPSKVTRSLPGETPSAPGPRAPSQLPAEGSTTNTGISRSVFFW